MRLEKFNCTLDSFRVIFQGSVYKKNKISTVLAITLKMNVSEFQEAFRLFDKDDDGSITKQELGRVMRSLGQFAREEELERMLQEVDIDGRHSIFFTRYHDKGAQKWRRRE